ncbi:hypothetical protein JXQ70_07295 [bacterium]|nr:hypothetical protein [bacterium]
MTKRSSFILLFMVLVLAPALTSSAQIIANHTVVDLYDQIPQQWIDEVKKMLVCIPGESHGRGYMYSFDELEQLDSNYAFNPIWTGAPEAYTDQYLRVCRTYRNAANTGWNSSGGEEDFYTSTAALNMMQQHLNYMLNTVSNPVSVFMFGWCWDMTWHNNPGGEIDPVYQVRWAGSSEGGPQDDLRWGLDADDELLTGNSVNMQTYLQAVEYYNTGCPETKTVFTTGPVDGNSYGENGYQRYLKHEYIRAFVQADPGRVLFDYADILNYNDQGIEYRHPTGYTDHGGTFHTFPSIHPDNQGNYDGGSGACHIGQQGCLRLGKALWWMLARIAGWDGSTANTPQPIPDGSDPSTPVLVSKISDSSSALLIEWDDQCSPLNTNIIYGPLNGFDTYAITDAVCGIDNPETWTPPDSNLWFVLVSDNDLGTESSWGQATSGERNGSIASNTCANTLKDLTGTCP